MTGSTGPGDPELADRLALALGRADRRLLRVARSLGPGRLSALATLHRFGPLRPGEIAAREFTSAPTVTRILDELDRRGLIVRTQDPDDGRAVLIDLTADGHRTVIEARAARAAILSELFALLDPGELAALAGAVPALERLAGD